MSHLAPTSVPLADLHVMAFLDPAGINTAARVRATTSRSAFVCGAMDRIGRALIFESYKARMTVTAMKQRVWDMCLRWKPRPFYVEASGMQELWVAELQAQAASEGRREVQIAPYKQPRNADGKDGRIRRAIRGMIDDGRVVLVGPRHDELVAELESFPMSPQKDLVDALASLLELLPQPRIERVAADAGQDRLAALRTQGYDPAYIAEVAAGRL